VIAQRAVRLLVPLVVVGFAAACSSGGSASKPSSSIPHQALSSPGSGTPPTFIGAGAGHLAAGSNPAVLPGSVLIADEGNDRLVIVDRHGRVAWTFPQPGDLPAGVEFKTPDDAFFTPDGRQIIVTEEEYSVVSLIDIASRKIVWRHGTPGSPGAGPYQLSNPDDAIVLPNGSVLLADIKNCRLLLFDEGAAQPRRVYGTTGSCVHDPPARYGSPNGAFPMRNGHYLVTEINGDWVDEIDLTGKVYASTQPPGIAYPSDTNEVTPGTYLTVDYSDPGQIETFNASGTLLWRYQPAGTLSLNHPSLALPLPNGDVLATDDHNDRIIVIDPKTNQIVWQYGQRNQPGLSPGLLNGPDGLDLAPPHSDLVTHAKTMGVPG